MTPNKLKKELQDWCWYKTCYADGLKPKDTEEYANIMAEELMKMFEAEKQELLAEIEKIILEEIKYETESSLENILQSIKNK